MLGAPMPVTGDEHILAIALDKSAVLKICGS
jgi:hypothetical protein